jgi:hypothetical protein
MESIVFIIYIYILYIILSSIQFRLNYKFTESPRGRNVWSDTGFGSGRRGGALLLAGGPSGARRNDNHR